MIFKNSVIELAENYDYFILDIWGVIHDGNSAYPLVIEHLEILRKLGKKICLLSNAPRRSYKIKAVLEKLKISAALYDFIVTSGEVVYEFLEKNQQNNFSQFGKNYYYIGPQKDLDLLAELGYARVDDASGANFLLATGFDDDDSKKEEKLSQLREGLENNLIMICPNPDLIVVRKNGQEMFCAGILAQQYKEMGGEVVYFGKPYNQVYKKVFELFSIKDKTKLIAIGDGIETDILGANNNQIASALVSGGILSNQLKINYGQLANENEIRKICEQYKIFPQFILARL